MPTPLHPRARLGRLASISWLALAGWACHAPTTAEPHAGTEPAATTPATQPYRPYLERLAAHTTVLRADEPSAGRFEPGFVPDGAAEIHYRSGPHDLRAWWAAPPEADAPAPALLYLHGAFALGPKDWRAVQPFREAGFAVLLPALRGENGNPGRQELLYGEVDDAVAAARWLAARPEVDPRHVYAAGHSIGGGVVALLALRPEAPVRLTASVGGIYVTETFLRWSRSKANAALVRFDPLDPAEGTLRTLVPNVRDLVHPHRAYIGQGDTWFHPNAEALAAEAARVDAPVVVERVPGDHMGSLEPALARYLEHVRAELAAPAPPSSSSQWHASPRTSRTSRTSGGPVLRAASG